MENKQFHNCKSSNSKRARNVNKEKTCKTCKNTNGDISTNKNNNEKKRQLSKSNIKRSTENIVEALDILTRGKKRNLKKASENSEKFHYTDHLKNNSGTLFFNLDIMNNNFSRSRKGSRSRDESRKKSKTEDKKKDTKEDEKENKEKNKKENGKSQINKKDNFINNGKNRRQRSILTKCTNMSYGMNTRSKCRDPSINTNNVVNDKEFKKEKQNHIDKIICQKNYNNLKRVIQSSKKDSHLWENKEELVKDKKIKKENSKNLNEMHRQNRNSNKNINHDELTTEKTMKHEKECKNTNMKKEEFVNKRNKSSDKKKHIATKFNKKYKDKLLMKTNKQNNIGGIDDSHLFNIGVYTSERKYQFDSDVEGEIIQMKGKNIKKKKKTEKEIKLENWILKNYFGKDSYGNKNEEVDPFFFGTV